MTPRTVVVGSSIGGVRTAQSLRSSGYEGTIQLVGEEDCLPYDKPPLSKGVLTGAQSPTDAGLLSAATAASIGIELVLGRRATRLDAVGSGVELDAGTTLPYDDLVIATGSRARPSPWPGPGVHVLRTLADAVGLREDLLRGGHVVVVGGGFIGAEVASSARALGLPVTIVDPVAVPMSRVLSAELGEVFLEFHRRRGVTTCLGAGVESVSGDAGDLTVVLTDGTVLLAATVVVGIGAVPNVEWLLSSGLLIDDGIVCDESGRASGAARVHAVGDASRWYDRDRDESIRVEHWTSAVEQAHVVAHNIAHPTDRLVHRPVEYVWSDQHDWRIQVAGRTTAARSAVLLGDPQVDRRFAALYTQDGVHLSGGVAVNWPAAAVACRRALGSGMLLRDVQDKLEAARRRAAGVGGAP